MAEGLEFSMKLLHAPLPLTCASGDVLRIRGLDDQGGASPLPLFVEDVEVTALDGRN